MLFEIELISVNCTISFLDVGHGYSYRKLLSECSWLARLGFAAISGRIDKVGDVTRVYQVGNGNDLHGCLVFADAPCS